MRRILKKRELLEAECVEGPEKLKHMRPSKFLELEKCLTKWMKQCNSRNMPNNDILLKEKARSFGEMQDVGDTFTPSSGWLEGCKKRHDIVLRVICGEIKKVDQIITSQWIKDLPNIVQGYFPHDVFNADETGLFFKCLLNKTYILKVQECHGGKISKERITVLLYASSSGSEKFSLLVVGKSSKPWCFKSVKKLPVIYRSNKKA